VNKQHKGFTIVELLVVIVIIGILAAITIVSYSGITQRANYAREQSDMKNINDLVQMYYAENGQYPSTGGSDQWWGWAQNTPFIPGIVPEYAAKMPQMPSDSDRNNSYLYVSDGVNYKLIRYSGTTGLPSVEKSNNSLSDPARPVTNPSVEAWGYWSSGAANW
jgi:general secretion pathway protein G